jgi:AbrB family looped-hinge helix DNA binding protein
MTKITTKGQVTIPKRLRDHLGLKPGSSDEFELVADGRVFCTIWGAQGSRVRLTDGLARTKETPTSAPIVPQPIPDSHPFHILRVGNPGESRGPPFERSEGG